MEWKKNIPKYVNALILIFFYILIEWINFCTIWSRVTNLELCLTDQLCMLLYLKGQYLLCNLRTNITILNCSLTIDFHERPDLNSVACFLKCQHSANSFFVDLMSPYFKKMRLRDKKRCDSQFSYDSNGSIMKLRLS